ncbi:MAG: hypothetical protein KatS3mg077_0012 [Candidatus Binatia bacterium]|nr:MAG: hypothetical protein KatS3mg077_0012 [Candidatus Binatia bacterium]
MRSKEPDSDANLFWTLGATGAPQVARFRRRFHNGPYEAPTSVVRDEVGSEGRANDGIGAAGSTCFSQAARNAQSCSSVGWGAFVGSVGFDRWR